MQTTIHPNYVGTLTTIDGRSITITQTGPNTYTFAGSGTFNVSLIKNYIAGFTTGSKTSNYDVNLTLTGGTRSVNSPVAGTWVTIEDYSRSLTANGTFTENSNLTITNPVNGTTTVRVDNVGNTVVQHDSIIHTDTIDDGVTAVTNMSVFITEQLQSVILTPQNDVTINTYIPTGQITGTVNGAKDVRMTNNNTFDNTITGATQIQITKTTNIGNLSASAVAGANTETITKNLTIIGFDGKTTVETGLDNWLPNCRDQRL